MNVKLHVIVRIILFRHLHEQSFVVRELHLDLVHSVVVLNARDSTGLFDQVVCNLVSLNSLINELFAKVKRDVAVSFILGSSDQGAAAIVEFIFVPRGHRRSGRIPAIDSEGELIFGERFFYSGLLIFQRL